MHQQVIFWAERLNGVCNARNHVARPECMNLPEKLLTDVKPGAGPLQIFDCKVGAPFPDKKRKAFNANESSVVISQGRSYGKICIMLEDALTVMTVRHFLFR